MTGEIFMGACGKIKMCMAECNQRRGKYIEAGALGKDLGFKLIQLKYKEKNSVFLCGLRDT